MRILIVAMLLLAGCTSQGELQSDPTTPTEPGNSGNETIEWGDASSPLRPGSSMGGCTLSFLYTGYDESGNLTYYIGTAAHCTGDVGDRISLSGYGEIGAVVYDSDLNVSGGGQDIDFTLIKLDEGVNLDAYPGMLGTNGPTGVATPSDVQAGDISHHHGYAMVVGETEQTRDRQGIITAFGDEYCIEGAVWWGDSGGPILHESSGKALGVVSRAGWVGCLPAAQVMGPGVHWILEELHAVYNPTIELATV